MRKHTAPTGSAIAIVVTKRALLERPISRAPAMHAHLLHMMERAVYRSGYPMYPVSRKYSDNSISLAGIARRICDIGVLIAGGVIATKLFGSAEDIGFTEAFVAFSVVLALLVFPVFGLYTSYRRWSSYAHVLRPIAASMAVTAGSGAIMSALHRNYRATPLWFVCWAVVVAGGLVSARALMWQWKKHIARVSAACPVAVVGDGDYCATLARDIAAMPHEPYRVAAIFDTAGRASTPHAPVHRDMEAFVIHVRRFDIEEIWLALPLHETERIQAFVDAFQKDLVNIRFMPDTRGVAMFSGDDWVNVAGAPALNLVASPLSERALYRKAIFDRLFAFCVLIAISPLMAAIAVAVKLSSPGPVFFRQQRRGANGRKFSIYKFRSMHVHQDAPGEVRQATRNDPRVTRLGAFLRRTSLDELPQFINVLCGDMSVVGPRPHAVEHDLVYQDLVDGYIHRYRVKPGITGWAQVNGFRGETDRIEKMNGRIEHDLYYLRNWSLALDIRIIVATVFRSAAHRNAY
ncbi:undecaprenyl-phosphate glucose phosphotransferase [Burkholderia sp. BE12]|uniref:undecaprenyl-phosphate glucose phosphotransferase n=1 Tax=Burkholderia sp. BE12 TaxID=2082394 RepID=UPI001F275C16|nr:undecaprenyl-phosphate glucose phosphotransferase [Burkholderia sp. BE12]